MLSGFEMVAMVIAAFFVVGIGVGLLLILARPGVRRRGQVDWPEPPAPDDDTRPRWPGGTTA